MEFPKKLKIKTKLKVFYVKWVLGVCRHNCKRCDYWYDCWSNLDDNWSGKGNW